MASAEKKNIITPSEENQPEPTLTDYSGITVISSETREKITAMIPEFEIVEAIVTTILSLIASLSTLTKGMDRAGKVINAYNQIKKNAQALDSTIKELNEIIRIPTSSADDFTSLLVHDAKNMFATIFGIWHVVGAGQKPLVTVTAEEDFITIKKGAENAIRILRKCIETESVISTLINDEVERISQFFPFIRIINNAKLPTEIIISSAHIYRRALYNLLFNAGQAMSVRDGENEEIVEGDSTIIEVSLSETIESYIITIKDSGPGIPPEILPDLFKKKVTTKENGTGTGLFKSHRLIEKAGGNLELVDSGPSGTTFRIIIPKTSCSALPDAILKNE